MEDDDAPVAVSLQADGGVAPLFDCVCICNTPRSQLCIQQLQKHCSLQAPELFCMQVHRLRARQLTHLTASLCQ